MYTQRGQKNSVWQPLEGYIRLRGTGQKITISDKIPHGEKRRYRLHVEPIVPGH
jgi:hypothetical protein